MTVMEMGHEGGREATHAKGRVVRKKERKKNRGEKESESE